MMNCYKSPFQECITIIILKIEWTRNQPPYCLLQIQEKMAFRLPWSGCLGTPLTLPQSLHGRTLTSESKFFGSTGHQICLPMVLWELRYKCMYFFQWFCFFLRQQCSRTSLYIFEGKVHHCTGRRGSVQTNAQ